MLDALHGFLRRGRRRGLRESDDGASQRRVGGDNRPCRETYVGLRTVLAQQAQGLVADHRAVGQGTAYGILLRGQLTTIDDEGEGHRVVVGAPVPAQTGDWG